MSGSERSMKYIYQLPYQEERELCTILDLNDRWEELGGKYMGYTVLELYDIKRVEKCGESPTRRLLQLWGQRNNKILKLYYFLFQMQHYQAMTVLEPFVSKEYHILEQDTEITRALKALGQDTHSEVTNSTYLNSHETRTSQNNTEHFRHNDSNANVAQAIGTRTQHQSINHNLNNSSTSFSKQPTNQVAEKTVNKVPDSLLQPLKSLEISTPSNNQQLKESGARNKNDICNKHHEKSTLLSGSSCEENNCSKCQKKMDTTNGHFSNEYRLKALEKYPNLAPSEKCSEARASPTAKLVSDDAVQIEQLHAASLLKKLQSNRSDSSVLSDCSVPMIPFEELNEATDSFSNKTLLGKGGFGSVYKATWKLSTVAVKKINLEVETVLGTVGVEINQSLDELRYLQSFRHKNILQVFGFSADVGKPTCLIYEFMENGSLEDRLQCKRKFGERRGTSLVEPLCWETRLKIMLGTASALQYLHTVREKPIIHGDVKSANILLEKDFEPKLGDFGLAREGPNSHYTSVKVSRVNGTRAYIPSEYLRDRKLSTKVDTYSFGVVLFEVCSGLRAYDDKRRPQYLKAYIEDATDAKSLIDPKAGYQGKIIFNDLLELGKECTNDKHNRRPDMVTVFKQIGTIENTLKDQKKRLSEEQSTSTMMSIPHPSYIYSSAFPPASSPYSGSYVSSYAGGPSPPYSASYTPFAASPRSNYMQYMIRPLQIIQQPYHMPMPAPTVGKQALKVPQRNDNVSPSPTTSPSVIAEESDEISDQSAQINDEPPSETSVNSDFLPLLTDIGKKSSFLD